MSDRIEHLEKLSIDELKELYKQTDKRLYDLLKNNLTDSTMLKVCCEMMAYKLLFDEIVARVKEKH